LSGFSAFRVVFLRKPFASVRNQDAHFTT
jgi:hypothetical protein